jgi:CheY-like chemotaxis protein
MRRANQAAPEPPAPRLLVIDDEPDIRTTLRSIFADLGLEVDLASDGLEGLVLATANRPSVVLVDLTMPEMDGLQFIDACQAIPSCQGVPIVLMSDETRLAAVRPYLPRGAAVVMLMAKPFDLEALIAVVLRLARTPSEA